MKYIRVKWNHANPDEPVWLFSELDADGTEVRKLECFQNGFCDFASTTLHSGTTELNTRPLPALDKIARDPEFQPVEITKEEFEDVWLKRHYIKPSWKQPTLPMINRKKIIAGNWKMNKTQAEARMLVEDLLREIGRFDTADIVLCPPFTALAAVSDLLSSVSNIRLGAQNMHEAASGAYTGEISATMLRELYVRYVILGHSERRQYFHEDNATINRKTKAALAAELRPIVCVGETLPERESDQWKNVLETQLVEGLAGFGDKELADIVLAYEPVWAIGTGKTASPAQAEEAHQWIRKVLATKFSQTASEKIRIQYGGSVKPENAKELLSMPDIDGALVGGASLDARGFTAIIKNACLE